ncbi:hypothetical protein Tco_0660248 [Tanacetum coccineum]
MLDSCTTTTCMQTWGRMDYARALVDIRVDRALKDTMVISVPNPVGNCVTVHTIRVQWEWKPSRCGTCLVFSHDDIKWHNRVMADLRKKIMRNLWMTWLMIHRRIWRLLPRKLLERLVRLRKWDDMDFDDMGQAVKEVEHRNAYSESG